MGLRRSCRLLLAGLLAAGVLDAATFVVTTEEDSIAPCMDESCSLRAAILAANTSPDLDQIQVPAGHYILSLPPDPTPSGDPFGGDLDIIGTDLEIRGVPGSTIVDADRIDRVFQIFEPATVLLHGLVIRGGYSQLSAGVRSDGADLTIEKCWVTENEAQADGGGIAQLVGPLRLVDSAVSDNLAGQFGGGLRRLGVGTVSPAPLWIENTTFSGNVAGVQGGAIYSFGTGEVLIRNSTLVGNTAAVQGDLIYHLRSPSPVFSNSILEGQCFWFLAFPPESLGGNLGKDTEFCSLDDPSDLAVDDLQITDLANHGGPTPTHGLELESQALDHALDETCTEFDQRGIERPQDGDFDGTPHCDSGAFELEGPPIVEIPTLNQIGIVFLAVVLVMLSSTQIRRSRRPPKGRRALRL